MKLAITGKGGVGKTTISSTLARYYADQGKTVFAVDADPDANLSVAIGMEMEEALEFTPIAEMKDLVIERTGAKPGTIGGFFKLNPRVDDLPETLAREVNGVKVMVMGGIDHGGTGCVCPESALVRTMMRHLVVDRDDVVIMDMEAGIEHLARSTAEGMDALVIVVEPGMRSVQTAKTISRLAKDIGVERLFIVVNKVRDEEEAKRIEAAVPGIPVLGYVSESAATREADLSGQSAYDKDPQLVEKVSELAKRLEQLLNTE